MNTFTEEDGEEDRWIAREVMKALHDEDANV